MSKCKIALVALFLVVVSSVFAYAGTYTFIPSSSNLQDLPHANYFAWKMDLAIPHGETISEAVLTINNINNWTYEPNNNWLYVQLLDSIPSGGTMISTNIWSWNDVDDAGYNNFTGKGVAVPYTNSAGVQSPAYTDKTYGDENLTYSFKNLGLVSTLNTYTSDGSFGLGFDPDCHFYNCGVKFVVTTKPYEPPCVPEPSSILSFATGLMGLAGMVVRKKH